jgi:hypothetical protein
LLPTLVVSALIGGIALLMLRDLRRREAIHQSLATLRKAGGTYAQAEEAGGAVVVSIDLDAFVVDDAGTAHRRGHAGDWILPTLASFPRLRELSLQDSDVTDAGISQLVRLRSLANLNLRRTGITDDALPELERCASLRRLDLRQTLVTRQGVERLRRVLGDVEVLSDSQGGDAE